MKESLIIRDDDLSFWTKPEEIDELYKPLFDKKVKISFATIPFAVEMFNAGDFNTFYQNENPLPISENYQIIEYIKDKIKDNLVEIMLHGYNHLYSFKCNNITKIATKENLLPFREAKEKITFLGEYNYQNFESLNKKTKIGKEYLEDTFEVKITNFVPPSNQINQDGIKAIYNNKLNLSGFISKKYNREKTLQGFFTYLDIIKFYLLEKDITYPKIAKYGKHKELAGYALTPTTNLDRFEKQLKYCIKNNFPFQIATHYWELNQHKELKEKFYKIVQKSLSELKSSFLKEKM